MKKLESLNDKKFKDFENKKVSKLNLIIGGAIVKSKEQEKATVYKNSAGCTQADTRKDDKTTDVGDAKCPDSTTTA